MRGLFDPRSLLVFAVSRPGRRIAAPLVFPDLLPCSGLTSKDMQMYRDDPQDSSVEPKPSKSLHRMLSKSGNPTMDNLSAILVEMKEALHVDIEAVVKAA